MTGVCCCLFVVNKAQTKVIARFDSPWFFLKSEAKMYIPCMNFLIRRWHSYTDLKESFYKDITQISIKNMQNVTKIC